MDNNKKIEEGIIYYTEKLKEVQEQLNKLLGEDYTKTDATELQLQYEALTNKIDILTDELSKLIESAK